MGFYKSSEDLQAWTNFAFSFVKSHKVAFPPATDHAVVGSYLLQSAWVIY